MLKRFSSAEAISLNLGLFILRIISGVAMLTHGWPKVKGFSQKADTFADPYDIGSMPSLVLAILAEFICSILLIAGLFTRMALLPLIITMITIILIVHGDDPFGKKELPLLYLAAYFTLFFTGPGKYSIDARRK